MNDMKLRIFKEFSAFQKYWNSNERYLDAFPYDLLSIFSSRYEKGTNDSLYPNVKETLTNYPYMIFLSENLLHEKEAIKIVSYIDKNMLKALMTYGDNETRQLLCDETFLFYIIKEYHCSIDQSMFPGTFESYMEKSDIFKLQYYADNYKYLLNTEEGNLIFRKYYVPHKHLHQMLKELTIPKTLQDKLTLEFNILENENFVPIGNILEEDEFEFLNYTSLIDLHTNSYMRHEEWLHPYILQMISFTIKYRENKTEIIMMNIDKTISSAICPNFKFYKDCALHEIPALVYSEKFKANISFWIETLKINPNMIKYVPKAMLLNEKFVLTVRFFVDEILFYCDEKLLDSKNFILAYLTFFSCKTGFRVGRELMLTKDRDFLEKVRELEKDALNYFVYGIELLSKSRAGR